MPPVAIAAGVTAVATAGSTYLKAKAQKKAAKKMARASERSGELIKGQYEQTREDLAPWRTIGTDALKQYAAELGFDTGAEPGAGFKESEGYKFRLSEGMKAVERSAASRGSLQSGATMKAVQRYGEGLAAEERGTYMQHLGYLAGMGQSSATQTGVFGASAATQIGAAGERAAGARASGYLGVADTIGSGMAGIAKIGGSVLNPETVGKYLGNVGKAG